MKNILKNKKNHPTEKLPMPHKVKRALASTAPPCWL